VSLLQLQLLLKELLLLPLPLLCCLELCFLCVGHVQSEHIRLLPPRQPAYIQQHASSSNGILNMHA
jgi:hypothetical protein